jgi:shikimate dehydrogenase
MLASQTIDGTTKLVGLLGWPVEHSLSPWIHNHIFARLDLPYAYVPLPVRPEKVSGAVTALRILGFAGANVTIPHKVEIAKLCDRLSPESLLTGAVNTLYFENDLLCGTTTDADGFLCALKNMAHDPNGGRIVILGNGGAARSIGFALADRKIPGSLSFIGRDAEKVSALTDAINNATGFSATGAVFDSDDAGRLIMDATLLVNCTSAGMSPAPAISPIKAGLLHKGLAVFDTIYNPAQTKLLSDARKAGCACSNGLDMLFFQGLASSKYWTGVDVHADTFDMEDLRRLVG